MPPPQCESKCACSYGVSSTGYLKNISGNLQLRMSYTFPSHLCVGNSTFFAVHFISIYTVYIGMHNIIGIIEKAQETSLDGDMHNTVLVPLLYFMNSGCVSYRLYSPSSLGNLILEK